MQRPINPDKLIKVLQDEVATLHNELMLVKTYAIQLEEELEEKSKSQIPEDEEVPVPESENE